MADARAAGVLLSNRARELPSLLQPLAPPAISPLPAEPRLPEILSLCLPTCSAALISERGELAAARMQFATQQEPTVVQLLENLPGPAGRH